MRRRIMTPKPLTHHVFRHSSASRNGAAPQTLARRSKSHRNKDEAMENRDSESTRLREQWHRAEESEATVAVIFAGIAALFVAGIAAAFIYANDTTFTQTARAPAPSAPSSAPASPGANAPAAQAPETTGSGTINRIPPKQDPRENEQREQP
jgi:hypothetical protein